MTTRLIQNTDIFGGNSPDLGNDRLTGAACNDKLDTGFGFDTLIGGDGSDRFFFDTRLDQTLHVDIVAGFTANVDKIVLDDDVFTHLGADGLLAAVRFHADAGAADRSDRIIYNPNTGFLFYDADGKGGRRRGPFRHPRPAPCHPQHRLRRGRLTAPANPELPAQAAGRF